MLKKTKRAVMRLPFARKVIDTIRGEPPYFSQIASPDHNSLVLYSGGFPLPPIMMRDKVRKSAILAEDFILEGRQAFEAIMSILRKHGVTIGSFTKIYEFGCGCGRIARYFIDEDIGEFIGSDVDADMIEWSTTNLSATSIGRGTLRFFTNSYSPPVQEESSSIDILYSISVFTHMDKEAQLRWLDETKRLLKPGGHLLVSILEMSDEELPSGVQVIPRIDREYQRTWLGQDGAPSIYYNTLNTVEYLKKSLQPDFQFVGYDAKAVRNKQSLVLFRKA